MRRLDRLFLYLFFAVSLTGGIFAFDDDFDSEGEYKANPDEKYIDDEDENYKGKAKSAKKPAPKKNKKSPKNSSNDPYYLDPKKYKMTAFDAVGMKYSNLAPTLSPDGKYLIYESNRGDEDHYRLFEVKLRNVDELGGPIRHIAMNERNTFEGLPYYSPISGHMLFAAIGPNNYKKRDQRVLEADLWWSQRVRGHWTEPTHFRSPVNTVESEITPCVSADGTQLYFSSNRPGGYGGYDLYVSRFDGKRWTVPVNLGPNINSEDDEVFPRVFPDGSRLYFSSNSEDDSRGGFDIFMVVRKGGLNSEWSKRENLGPFLNSEKNDYLNSIPVVEDFFLMSRGDQGEEKIYWVTPVPEFLRPNRYVYSWHQAVDAATKNQLPFKLEASDEKGKVVFRTEYTPVDVKHSYNPTLGAFWQMPTDRPFFVFVSSPGYLFYTDKIQVNSKKKQWRVDQIYKLQKLKPGIKVPIRSLKFKPNSVELLPQSKPGIYQLARFLQNNPRIKIMIEGHTAKIAGDKKAVAFSKRRAQAVAQKMRAYGIAKGRFNTKGYGYRQPISSGKDKQSRALNRRVEIKIVSIK